MQRFNHSTPPHTCSYLWEIRNPPPTAGNPESVTVTHSHFTHRIQFLPFLVLILSLGGALHNPRDPTTLARGPRSAGVSVGPSQQPHSRPPCFTGYLRRRAWDNPKERIKKQSTLSIPSYPILMTMARRPQCAANSAMTTPACIAKNTRRLLATCCTPCTVADKPAHRNRTDSKEWCTRPPGLGKRRRF